MTTPDEAGRMPVDAPTSVRANRAWWDAEAADYLAEHGDFLGAADFVWGPEGWTEEELQILGRPGDLRGRTVLEFGAGAAQAGRWVAAQGARVVASDIAAAMLRHGAEIDARRTEPPPALLQCDAGSLPFADGAFDIVFSAFGAVPFIADTASLMRELARVVRPGGLVAFSTTHPIRWAFPDVPTASGLVAEYSYFDTTPYAEAEAGRVVYAEHHRTLEQRVTELLDAGLRLEALRELAWKAETTQTWGGWSPLRGARIPGTLVLVGRKPT